MKKLRALVPVFSFGLILAYAYLSQFGDGSFVEVSKVYAHSSKNFSSISENITLSVVSIPSLLVLLAYLVIIIGLFVYFYRRCKKKNKSNPAPDEQELKEPEDA